MLPPKIVLLIGNRGESVQAIQQSLSAHYQVVLFHKVEKEVSWFNPIAVILHQNGGPADEVMGQLHQLKQLKPEAPVMLCHSGQQGQPGGPYLEGIQAALAWPGELSRMRALLLSWEQKRFSLAGRLRMAWRTVRRLFFHRVALQPQPSLLPPVSMEMAPVSNGLDARLFGPFELRMDGRVLPPIRSEVNRAMLAYLLYNGPERMPRHKIIEGFWPDSNEEAARNCLNVAISSVRKYWREMGGDHLEICFQDNAYCLQLPDAYRNDARAFLKLWEQGKSLERAHRMDEALNVYRQACRLYTGDFLEGISRNIDWVESTRSKLREAYLSILDRLSCLFMERGLYQEAEEACQEILEIDDCIESAHRQLIILYYKTNRRGRALRQYAMCCQALQDRLGVSPFRETEELYHKAINGGL
ncbi:MAG: hypothetical protein KDD19_08705 [Phaeodactylibacter sp.]|nr:hypothetical protein [Phaeodactylibacter sp.]MCB9053204.1 hypothetical protein [Lewinellaceae bacterium]